MKAAVAVVTGGTRGIGEAIADTLASDHAVVTLSRGGKEEIADQPDVEHWRCDVSNAAALSAVSAQMRRQHGRVDVVVAAAGVSVDTSFTSAQGVPAETWSDVVGVNVLGVALTAKTFFPLLVESTGHLVIVGSAAGRTLRIGSLYSATKWAVTALAQSIRAEAVGTGVRVTVVQPGVVATTAIPPDRTDSMLQPVDIARIVRFCVDQPSHVDVNEVLIRALGQDASR